MIIETFSGFGYALTVKNQHNRIGTMCLFIIASWSAFPTLGCRRGAPTEIEHENVRSKANAYVISRLKAELIDPDSMKLRNLSFYQQSENDFSTTYVVCGEVNAKNRFGGYTGFTQFFGTAFAEKQQGEPQFTDDSSAVFIDAESHHRSFEHTYAENCKESSISAGHSLVKADTAQSRVTGPGDDSGYGIKGEHMCRLEGVVLAGDYFIDPDRIYSGRAEQQVRDSGCAAEPSSTPKCVAACKDGFDKELAHVRSEAGLK